MKAKMLMGTGIVLTVIAVVLVTMRFSGQSEHKSDTDSPQHASSHDPSSQRSAKRVPAFYATAPSSLPPTLAPERFIGKTQAAYRAVREIPTTIAQLPCYCYCDQGHGHKSLHSCYEDEHAGSCAVCVDEVLLAYQLEKEKGLSPAQIRQVIIDKYSASN